MHRYLVVTENAGSNYSEERALLDSRLADLEANPDDQGAPPWPEVKVRLEQRRR